MKKILLLSDTHGYIGPEILKYVNQVDEVWHAGDIGTEAVANAIEKLKPLKAVYGNIDGAILRKIFPFNQRFYCEGIAVWMTHIGGYPANYNPIIRKEININPPDLFVCGHTHILKVMRDQRLNLLHMNPGAVGKYGFHKVRTMLRFEIQDKIIQKLEVIEFKR